MDQDLGRAVLHLVTDPTALKAGISAARAETVGAIREANQALASAGAQMSQTGQKLSIGVTLPVVAAGKAIVGVGTDFDTTMRRVVGLAGVAGGAIGGIKNRIMELGGETGKTPQELAEAFYFVASAGFKADEAMDVLETSAKASAAGLGEVQDVAKVLGLTINAYGHENITAAKAADILTAAVRDGTAEADAFAGVLGRVVPTAAQMGVSFDQVTASLAGMTITGLSADEAATSLNQVLVSLLKPTAAAEEALAGMGTSSGELREELREKGLLATLRDLQSRFEGNDDAAAKVFGNVRALRGVLSLLGLDTEQLNDIFADTKGALGDLQEGYDATEGPAREMARAQAELDAALIDLSTDVLPVVIDLLKGVVGVVRDAVAWFKTLPPGVRESVVQILALVAALGPLLIIGGNLVGAFAGIYKGLDKVAVMLVSRVAPALVETNLAAGPLLLILVALIDLVQRAPAMFDAWGDAMNAVSHNDIPAAAQALRDFAAAYPDWIPGALLLKAAFEGQAKSLDDLAAATIAAAAEQTVATGQQIDSVDRLKGSWVPAVAKVKTAYEQLTDDLKKWAEQTEEQHAKALTAQRDYTKNALDVLRGFRRDIESAYSDAQDAELDFEKTTVAIATKQAELTQLDKDYLKHKGTMTKLEIAEYKLRRHEIVAEMNGLKLHLALIGDDMHKATALQSLLTGKDMKEGLTSKMPETQAAYRALRDEALLELQRIEANGGPASKKAAAAIAKYMDPDNPLSPLNDSRDWGAEVGRSYLQGMAGAIAHNTYLVKAALGGMRTLLLAGSPPHSPDNPLHEIDVWGEETGMSWVQRLVAAITAAPALVRGALGDTAAALSGGLGATPGLTLAAAGAGIGSEGGFSRNARPRPDGGPGASGIVINGGIHIDARGATDPEAVGVAAHQGVEDAMAGALRDQSLRGETGVH